MKNLILTLIITLPLTLLGQGWEQVYNDTTRVGISVEQTTDNGYIICGYENNNPIYPDNTILLKTDINGDTIWTKVFNKGECTCVKQTNDDGYILSTRWGIWSGVIKTDSNGDTTWTKNITYGFLESIKQTSDGGYILCGYENPNLTNGPGAIFLLKIDENGNEDWIRTFYDQFGNNDNKGYCVEQTNDGGYVICGSPGGTLGGGSLIIKTNNLGILQWTELHTNSNLDVDGYTPCIKQTSDGGYVTVSVGYSNLGCGSEEAIILRKLNSSGTQEWSNIFYGISMSYPYSVKQTNDDGYIICGITEDWTGFSNTADDVYGYVIKTDSNGDEEWSNIFQGIPGYSNSLAFSRVFTDVEETSDGSFILTGADYGDGWVFGSTDISYIILTKLNSQGNITSTIEIPLPNSNRKLEKTLDILGKETKPQPNTPIIEIYDDGSVEKKVIIE